jgi:hypothetical protein
VVALNTEDFVAFAFVSNNAAFFRFALISYAHRPMTSVYCSFYSVAVTSSPNLSLYAQLTMVIYSIYSSNLQRYTVAGLCGVATSVW